MRLSVKLCLAVIALYALAALFGGARYLAARWTDTTASYNVVHSEARYLPPLSVAEVRTDDGGTAASFFLLGTDNLGRSVGERLVQGAMIAFVVLFI